MSTLTKPRNGKAITTACSVDGGRTTTDVTTLKLLILFLFGYCGMIVAFLLGRTWSQQVRQLLLLGMDGPEMVDSFSSALTEGSNITFQNTEHPPLHRPMKASSLVDTKEDICNDDQSNTCVNFEETTTTRTTTSIIAPRKLFHELLVHPLLLNIEPSPQSVVLVLWTNQQTAADDLDSTVFDEMQREISSLLNEIIKHRSVTEIHIVAEDPITQYSCHAIVSTIHLKRPVSLSCTSMDKFSKQSTGSIVDAVILPSWPPSDDDYYDEDEDEDDEDMMMFWYDRLSSHGALVTILGTTYSLQRIVAREHMVHERWYMLEYLKPSFPRIIDYDIPASYYFYDDNSSTSRQQRRHVRAKFPINVGVAFKSLENMAYWRLNEAHYNIAMKEHLTEDGLDDLVVFDSAVMLQLQYPPSHSSWYYCGSYKNASDCDFHGYDPEFPNIPLSDLYVSKSKAGENAGRGVFTNVDIPANSNIALEATTQSIHYEWKTTELHRTMMETVNAFAQGKGRIVFLYAEAYGYASDPYGKQQETVMSHFLTFVNHGCNGTANLGERWEDPATFTEWNVDLSKGIPDDLATTLHIPYNPVSDRDLVRYATNCVVAIDVPKGGELYDNYMNFGGDEYFEEMVLTLRDQCSGGLGLVEMYQRQQKTKEDRLRTKVGGAKKDS